MVSIRSNGRAYNSSFGRIILFDNMKKGIIKEKESAIILASILLIGSGLFLWQMNFIDGQLALFGMANMILGVIAGKTFLK